VTSPPAESESDAVLAFMRERQAEVLANAIDLVATASPENLAAAVHKASGSVGSYRLDAAHALLSTLMAVMSDPAAEPSDIRTAHAKTVDALRALGTGGGA
jgi:hypothetical protein